MKKNLCYSLLLALLVGCNPEQIVLEPISNPFEVFPTKFRQNVLIEQFVSETHSGTLQANHQLNNWKFTYPYQLIPVSVHSNDWLTIDYNNYFATKYGGLMQLPCAAINRQLGINSIVSKTDSLTFINIENYHQVIENELSKTPPLVLSLNSMLDSNKIGTLDIYIAHNSTIESDTRIGIYLVEDNVKAIAQEGAAGDFYQEEVLRDVITDYDGDTISLMNNSILGMITKRSYADIDLSAYNLTKMKFVVFLFQNDSNFKKSHIINSQTVRIGGKNIGTNKIIF